MAGTLKHAFTSAATEGTDANKVRASNWNADHTFSGGVHGDGLIRSTVASQGAVWSSELASLTPAGWFKYAAWGDSLTAGSGGTPYPTALGTLLGREVTVNGVGGQTSTQIGVRQGGVTTTVTVSGGQIPASGGVTVTFPAGYEPVTSQSPTAGVLCSIAGVTGRVTYSGGTITFTRALAGSIVSASGSQAFTVDTQYQNGGFVIIWAGRNNFQSATQVKADIAAMVASLTHTRYLILSILNQDTALEYSGQTNYNAIIQLNTDLAALYPNNYLDIRAYLVSLYDAGTPQDVIDHGRDVPPSTLRSDTLHLNTAGYAAVASRIYTWLQANDATYGRAVSRLSDELQTIALGPALDSGAAVQWRTPSSVIPDVKLFRDGAGQLGLRNDTTNQALHIYERWTNEFTYGRLRVISGGTFYAIYTDNNGSGTSQRPLRLGAGGAYNWEIQTSGHLFAFADATYDIGATGANRPRNLFLSADITTGSTTLHKTSVALTNGAAANTGTLTNAPAAGNPTKWVPINDNGTTRYIPAW